MNDLIPKKGTPFSYTQPDTFFQGSFNPIEKRVVTRGVCIDTLFRPNYQGTSSTDFMYEFPEHQKNIVSMRVAAIEIPIVWYAFSNARKNNIFYVDGKEVIIPEGNYTSEDMVDALIKVFTTLGISITPSISTSTTKLQFTSSVPFTLSFEIESGNCGSGGLALFQTCGWNLGFRKKSYQFDPTFTGPYVITGESSYGSSFDNYFFIEIDDFQRNFVTDSIVSVVKTTNVGYLGKNIIARIPITTSFNVITLNNSSDGLFKTRDYFGPVRLEKLHIRLLDRFGQVISLNQNDFSIMIELKELFS
jgi:hypothetical protein